MDKVYPAIYGQQNYPDKLGSSSTATIATDGCFVTSLAMKAGYYGHILTPSDLNKLFTEHQPSPIYIQGDLLPDNALSLVFPDIKYIKTFDYEPIPTDLNNIKTLLADNATTITIRINRGNGNLHFVEAVSCDGTTLHIADPWTGQIDDFSKNYGNPVSAYLHVIVYTGTVPANQPTNAVDPTPSLLAQRFNQAITKANNFDTVADYLGITPDQRVTNTAGQTVVSRFQQLTAELKQATDSLAALPATPVIPVAPPVPVSAPQPAPQPQPIAFTDGTMPVASNNVTQVPKTVSPPPQARKLTPLAKLWKTLVFWLG